MLCTEGWLPFKRKHFGHDPELERQANDLSGQLNAGFLTNDDFVQKIAGLAGVPVSEAIWAVHHNIADEELFAYIRQHLKGRYKLGILSNAGGNRLRELFSPGQLEMFDEASLSFETGYVKPDPRAYERIAASLGVSVEECVFVDDQERHCTAARGAGMQAVQYRDFEQFRSELRPLLATGKN